LSRARPRRLPPPPRARRRASIRRTSRAQLKPVFADGRIVGADISGADASLLARLGLKPTDVVTAINGTPLAGVTNPQQLMEQLQSSSSVQVTVQRDGKPATLTLSLR
jgi:general secretion pathway protein C